MVLGFFDNLREHSEVKHRILASFLTPWAAKLGSMVRGKSGVIWYVDGFAGAGRYGDGRDGSPLKGWLTVNRTTGGTTNTWIQ